MLKLEMAANLENLECVICSNYLTDPRALPCGHSYCGPPRLCLDALKNGGSLRCAVCRVDHNLKAEDIKPLYGIRDFIQGTSSQQSQIATPELPCTNHGSHECSYWCNDCNAMICALCFETEHDGHSVRSLKNYLTQKLESQLGKNRLNSRVRELSDNLTQSIELMKVRKVSLEKDITEALQKQEVIDDYCKFLTSGDGDVKKSREIILLYRLSRLDLSQLSRPSGFSNLPSGSDVSKVEAPARETSKASVSVKRPICDKRLGTSRTAWTFNFLTSERLIDCNCILKHSEELPRGYPICLLNILRVVQRHPLLVEKSGELIVCPFQFWITAEVINHKFKRNDKMFRIIVNCRHADDGRLPVSTFEYGLRLLKNENSPKVKEKRGIWTYPKSRKIFWNCIDVSELLDRREKWIRDDDTIQVILELKL